MEQSQSLSLISPFIGPSLYPLPRKLHLVPHLETHTGRSCEPGTELHPSLRLPVQSLVCKEADLVLMFIAREAGSWSLD